MSTTQSEKYSCYVCYARTCTLLVPILLVLRRPLLLARLRRRSSLARLRLLLARLRRRLLAWYSRRLRPSSERRCIERAQKDLRVCVCVFVCVCLPYTRAPAPRTCTRPDADEGALPRLAPLLGRPDHQPVSPRAPHSDPTGAPSTRDPSIASP